MAITTGNEGGDAVNHPPHYNQHPSGVECIDIIRHFNLDVGSAIKYLWRAGLKTELTKDELAAELQDVEKAIWFLTDHVEELRRRRGKPYSRTVEDEVPDPPHAFLPGEYGPYCAVCSYTRGNKIHAGHETPEASE